MRVFWLRFRGTRFPVRRGETILGRSPYCSVVVSNGLASRQHAALRLTGDALFVEDLESSNGTFVNDERVAEPRPLEDGDVLRIGSDLLKVEVGASIEESGVSTLEESMKAPDESTHRHHASGVELLESLAAGAADSPDRVQLVPALRTVVEEIVLGHTNDTNPLGEADQLRMRAVVQKIGSFVDDSALARWCDRMLAALDG